MIVGIDLGTTHSLVAVWHEAEPRLMPNALGQFLTPSVVSISDTDEILVGLPARERLFTHPQHTAATFKRYMGTDHIVQLGKRSFRPEELSAFVLRSLKADAETFLDMPVSEAVITVPAYFNDRQRQSDSRPIDRRLARDYSGGTTLLCCTVHRNDITGQGVSMETGLAGKVVLITGATRNHGRASALAFAAEGAHLLLCTRQSMELLEETAHLAAPCGVKVLTNQCDVTDETQVKTFVQKGLSEFGRIDVVVNNAGWRARGELLRISTENWLATLAVNLHAPFLMSQAVLPSMVQHRWGRIINYSGISPFRGATGGTAKMAVAGLTRAIAREYGVYNITANLIGPGSIAVVRTPGQEIPGGEGTGIEAIPIPRQGTVDECTATVVFLASEQASYITGQTYLVNGGAYFL